MQDARLWLPAVEPLAAVGRPSVPDNTPLGGVHWGREVVGMRVEESSFPTTAWHALPDGRLRCDVCPRACALHDGQRGLCFVRRREGERVVLTTYGRSSGFCVDPIEKKPLNHFLPGSAVLSFGTAGCNLTCRFCQNWDISKSREVDTLADQATPDRIARTARDLGCRSVAFTYNDPTIFYEYARDTAIACHDVGVRAVAVTAGYLNPEPRADLYAHMDAANVDLKAFTDDFYHRVCSARLAPVLETIEYLVTQTPVWVELTTLLIPGLNDSEAELDEMTRWVVDRLGPDVPMHFTAFHPDFKMRDRPPTPPQTLTRARGIAQRNGVRYAYTGNVHDRGGGSTVCPGCGTVVVERDWYTIGQYRLTDDGHCRTCGTAIPGVFDGPLEHWGARRMPVVLAERSAP
jgi:pyruvate formate lyase activating enzyme